MTIRNYTIDFSNPIQAAIDTINMHRDGLISFRQTTDDPLELEWEIRLYDYMLLDPKIRLDQYYKARFDFEGIPIPKREVVKKLGWDVP